MKKQYEELNITVLNYNKFPSKYITTSDLDNTNTNGNDKDLNNDDKIDYFG